MTSSVISFAYFTHFSNLNISGTNEETKRYTSNSLKLVEEVTLQILFLDTKPFVISTDELFQVDAYF